MWRPSNPGGPGLPHNVQRNQGMPPPQQQVGECVSLLCMYCSMKGIGKGTWSGCSEGGGWGQGCNVA